MQEIINQTSQESPSNSPVNRMPKYLKKRWLSRGISNFMVPLLVGLLVGFGGSLLQDTLNDKGWKLENKVELYKNIIMLNSETEAAKNIAYDAAFDVYYDRYLYNHYGNVNTDISEDQNKKEQTQANYLIKKAELDAYLHLTPLFFENIDQIDIDDFLSRYENSYISIGFNDSEMDNEAKIKCKGLNWEDATSKLVEIKEDRRESSYRYYIDSIIDTMEEDLDLIDKSN